MSRNMANALTESVSIDGLAPEWVRIRARKFAQLAAGKQRKPATALRDLCRDGRILRYRHKCGIGL
jgi:hypothetical protein